MPYTTDYRELSLKEIAEMLALLALGVEHAAVAAFCGGLPHVEAERPAWACVLRDASAP
jgi:hypothetical protein